MKKIIILVVTMLSLLLFAFDLNAQEIIDDNGEDEIVISGGDVSGGGPNRGSSYIPLRAFFIPSSSCISIYFLDEIGDVTITITNLSTGEYCSTIVDSQYGRELIPLSGGAGYYLIRIETSGGLAYYGYFSIYL